MTVSLQRFEAQSSSHHVCQHESVSGVGIAGGAQSVAEHRDRTSCLIHAMDTMLLSRGWPWNMESSHGVCIIENVLS